MSLWLLVAWGLMLLSVLITLVAWGVAVVAGFKAHAGWGIANLLSPCLMFLPPVIFSVLKLEERWPLLVLLLGGIIPLAVGMGMGLVEGLLVLDVS